MNKNLFFLIPVFLLLLHCSSTAEEAIIPTPALDPEQVSISRNIRKKQVLELVVNDFKPGLEATEYLWSSSEGAIISQTGRSAIYQAPEREGKVRVSCQSLYDGRLLGVTHFEINVFTQVVVLKADDLVYEDESVFPKNWNKYFELVEKLGIKGSAGIIGNSLENAPQTYFEKIRHHHQNGHIEFWNHGYTHLLNGRNEKGEVFHEFNNSGFEYQRSHLERTQILGKEKLGITFRAFGAPGNQIDEITKSLIDESDDIRLWFYGHPESRKSVLKRTQGCEIEFPVHHPSFEKFVAGYRTDVSFLVLQFHPTRWSTSQFEEFRSIVQYLIDQQVYFMNPTEMAKEFYPELMEGVEEIINIL